MLEFWRKVGGVWDEGFCWYRTTDDGVAVKVKMRNRFLGHFLGVENNCREID
jgi:hypothetical protein